MSPSWVGKITELIVEIKGRGRLVSREGGRVGLLRRGPRGQLRNRAQTLPFSAG